MKKPPKKSSFFSEIIASFILFGLVVSILDYLFPVLPFLIGAVFLGIIGYIWVKLSKNSEKVSKTANTYPHPSKTINTKGETIKRQMQILTESIESVNNSNNLDIVLRRYNIVRNTIKQLMIYTDDDFRAAGFVLKESLSHTENFLQDNKILIINQAIERNINHEIDSLKTMNGKQKRLDTLYNSMKESKLLEPENLSFLEELCYKMKENFIQEQQETLPHTNAEEYLAAQKSSGIPNISSEISDLVWYGDGIHKNYTPQAKDTTCFNSNIIVFTESNTYEEPSAIYSDLPIIKPSESVMVESPPYYPSYKELSPQQRWEYWKFLSNPFSSQNDVGYAFLFYYGLERHLLSGKLDKAFEITLKLRSYYSNQSFQLYTANALFLTCITKNRADLVQKLIASSEQNLSSTLPPNILLMLKYKFEIPLNASDIIENHRYFGFTNNRYIENEPELFSKVLSEFLVQNFKSDCIDLNEYFPMDIEALPSEQREMFINSSLRGYKASAPIFNNKKLSSKISTLLYDTHETVKRHLRYHGNTDLDSITYIQNIDNLFGKNTFKNMSGHDFEKYCARLLSLNGFTSITVTKDSGDQGIDIIAYKKDTKYGIQCKLYSNHVGNSAVQEAYAGKDFYKCQIGAVLTNNDFTESAKELADSLGILLWDGNYLYQLQQNCKKTDYSNLSD